MHLSRIGLTVQCVAVSSRDRSIHGYRAQREGVPSIQPTGWGLMRRDAGCASAYGAPCQCASEVRAVTFSG